MVNEKAISKNCLTLQLVGSRCWLGCYWGCRLAVKRQSWSVTGPPLVAVGLSESPLLLPGCGWSGSGCWCGGASGAWRGRRPLQDRPQLWSFRVHWHQGPHLSEMGLVNYYTHFVLIAFFLQLIAWHVTVSLILYGYESNMQVKVSEGRPKQL